jgi:putative glycosyltransferase (TIGR04372 family)
MISLKVIISNINIINIFQLISGIIFYILHRVILKKKIFLIPSRRIGHLAAEMNLHHIKNSHLKQIKQKIYIYTTPICNEKLFEICTKGLEIRSDEKLKFFITFITRFNLLDKFFLKLTDCNDRDVRQLRSTSDNPVKLSSEDRKLALDTLDKEGYSRLFHKKVILLCVRDSEYTKKNFASLDLSYHNYRNSDIQSYDTMVQYLLSKDFSVIRMGRETQSRQNIKNDHYWDYSNSNVRSDLLDIYLAEICYACITTGLGFDALTAMNSKPTLNINYLPHGYCNCFASTDYTCFKWLREMSTGKLIEDWGELYSRNVFTVVKNDDYAVNGFEVIDLSEDEILHCAKTFLQRIEIDQDATKDMKSSYEGSFEDLIKTRDDLAILHPKNPIVQLIRAKF